VSAKDISARWLKASGARKKEDQICGHKLAEMVKMHYNEGFYALDDPLESAVFSVLIELMRELERANLAKRKDSDCICSESS